uniref:Zinc knuckle domain-containing protein n=1 Tax=Meloidogyne incognita TaxID=6306 RepID=A0A914NL53_MELIC
MGVPISADHYLDIIDVIRTLSTQAAQGQKNSPFSKFARGNTRSIFEDMQNKQQKHCQRIFERQNKWLSNAEPDSDLDGEESSGDDLHLDERFKEHGDVKKSGTLKIYRTIKNTDGTESTRVETVIHPQLIEAYIRIRSTRDESFIKVYAQMDENYKEEKRKERRRQQEDARKSKKVEKPPSPPPPKPPKELKITCSACGGIGHMKTNRNCPLYGKEEELASKTVGEICQPPVSRISDILDEEGCSLPSGELIEVDGTRLKISKKLYKHAEKERKNALRLHIPRKILESGGGIVSKKFGKKTAKISSLSSLTRAIPPVISKQELLASIPSTSNFIPLNEDIQLGL